SRPFKGSHGRIFPTPRVIGDQPLRTAQQPARGKPLHHSPRFMAECGPGVAVRRYKGKNKMRIVALEEHYTVPSIVAGIPPEAVARRGFPGPGFVWAQSIKRDELADLGAARLADMDASEISVQVLSVAGPGADLVPGQAGVDLARAYNDALAEACARHPTRYRGFAHLPMLSPDRAAEELERTVKQLGFHGALVNGATDGRFLDDPMFAPILARAEALDVPLYLHPG